MSRSPLFQRKLAGFVWVLVASIAQTVPAYGIHDTLTFKVKDHSRLPLYRLVQDLEEIRVVTVGEQHDNEDHHRAQLLLISALHESGYDITIGFEQFAARSQAGLDEWVAGRSSLEELLQIFSMDWELNWWSLYLPIFQYAREHQIPMVGLNIPREIVSQVARKGFSSLNAKQRGEIKVLSCSIDQKYKDALNRVLGHKGKGGGERVFNNFCEAQVVWDTSMALNAVAYLENKPEKLLVILAGNFHSWKRGIPEQIKRVTDLEVRSILPLESTSSFHYDINYEDADYVWWFE